MKQSRITPKVQSPFYGRIRQILESTRAGVARSVNTAQVMANWLIGREIVEEEQRGQKRAGYGQQLIKQLSERLKADYGAGYSAQNLFYMRQFYLSFPLLLQITEILHAPRGKSSVPRPVALENLHALRGDSWQPGQFHPNLSWTHYRTLLRVDKVEARAFYEIESLKNNWSARELERQINSLLQKRRCGQVHAWSGAGEENIRQPLQVVSADGSRAQDRNSARTEGLSSGQLMMHSSNIANISVIR